MERERPVAGLTRASARPLDELLCLGAARAGKLQRAAVLVRDEFYSVVPPARKLLEPLSALAVGFCPSRAGGVAVGDVANEHVAKDVLDLACDRRAPVAADELLPLE